MKECEYCKCNFKNIHKENRFCSKKCWNLFKKNINKIKRQPIISEIEEYIKTHSMLEAENKFKISIRKMNDWKIYSKRKKKNLSCPNRLTQEQQEIINGNLLGDGSLTYMINHKNNSVFKMSQKQDNIEYIKWLHNIYSPYSCKIVERKTRIPSNVNGKINHDIENWNGKYSYECYFNSVAHPVFTELRKKWYMEPFVKNTVKIIPRDLKLTWLTAAIWACDDGNNCITCTRSEKYPQRRFRLFTNSFKKEDVLFLISLLKIDLNINAIISKFNNRKTEQYAIIIYGKEQEKFINGIKQYIPFKCLEYKIKIFERNKSANNLIGNPYQIPIDFF